MFKMLKQVRRSKPLSAQKTHPDHSIKAQSTAVDFSSYPSVNPNVSTSNYQSQSPNNVNGHVLQCNIALHLQNGQNFSEEVAKGHMALLVTVLESYESLLAGRIGNPMLTKEDYDQIDVEELELMDIKWCLASVLRRAEKFKQITGRDDLLDANVSTLGFDKSKVTCFRCREKDISRGNVLTEKQVELRIRSGTMNIIGKQYIIR
ncbi:hypothetical protein HanRHA438_Chr08g0333571 [Helianthus annuus]|nr:hypothetical protein HanRHA438_Chr08g0333571 [Helianthus annuus]